MNTEEKLNTIKVINKRLEEIDKELEQMTFDISVIEGLKNQLKGERERLFTNAENLMK